MYFRSLTLTPGKMRRTNVASAPKLPDVRACCVAAGVTHSGCVDKLCDPTKTYDIGVSWETAILWIIGPFLCSAPSMMHLAPNQLFKSSTIQISHAKHYVRNH